MSTYKWQVAQLLEYKWWQRYLNKKDPGNYIEWKKHYWQTLLSQVNPFIRLSPGDKVMDAGCGPAGIFTVLADQIVTAVDPLLDKYRSLAHFTPEKYSNTRFRAIPMEEVDECNQYNVIFCLNAINHVRDIYRCYRNLATALKPGGYLIISTDAHKHNFLKALFRLIPGDVLHPIQLNIKEYLAFLYGEKLELITNILYKKERIFDYYITIARKPLD